jgi:predicted DNA-binding transcriptional regulator AlpA
MVAKQPVTPTLKPPPTSFRTAGLMRLAEILAPAGPIPVSRSAWWLGVKSGRYPQPVKLGPRITAWRAEDIHQLINNGIKENQSA